MEYEHFVGPAVREPRHPAFPVVLVECPVLANSATLDRHHLRHPQRKQFESFLFRRLYKKEEADLAKPLFCTDWPGNLGNREDFLRCNGQPPVVLSKHHRPLSEIYLYSRRCRA